MVTKFYTVKDGVIGTAHINRHGSVVDFRPTSFSITAEGFVEVYAPDGQEKLPELTPDKLYWGTMGKKFPYVVTNTELGDGRLPNLIVTSVGVVIDGVELILPYKDSRPIDSGISTPQSIAFHEQWKAKVEELKAKDKAEKEAQVKAQAEASERFITSLPSLYAGMKAGERRWIHRFASDYKKAAHEVEGLFTSLDKEGVKGFKATHCSGYWDNFHEILSGKLKEVLQLN